MSTTPSPSRFSVATGGDLVLVRVAGLATLQTSVAFKEFLDQARERGFRKFVIDLGGCDGFDSTFMGTVLGIALERGKVVLLNVQPPQRKLLEDVGIHHIVRVSPRNFALPEVPMEELDTRTTDARKRFRHVLSAHENLVRHDARNRERFGPFLELLRQELENAGEP